MTIGRVNKSLRTQNPLLISGLVFAGANVRSPVREDRDTGILTAEEVAGMPLDGKCPQADRITRVMVGMWVLPCTWRQKIHSGGFNGMVALHVCCIDRMAAD